MPPSKPSPPTCPRLTASPSARTCPRLSTSSITSTSSSSSTTACPTSSASFSAKPKGRKGERRRLEEALRINQPLATAYSMKEEFRHFRKQEDWRAAKRFLDDWCCRAVASKLSVLVKMVITFRMHRDGLLNYDLCPISTGPLEGVNNKIKTLQRQAYGYRDEEFFHLRIDSLYVLKYVLHG